MQFQEDRNRTLIKINVWEPGILTINGNKHQDNLIFTESEILTFPLPNTVQQLTAANVDGFCNIGSDIFILGTGMKQVFPNRDVLEAATRHNIAIEVMDTRTACRIFTLLASEGRKILTILFID
ncbi:MAG: hypothetical protein GY829_16110 [Gammaproteobacteria bacterium]|nr:hypothetical protein [Gammaproteobacteria bacterium]